MYHFTEYDSLEKRQVVFGGLMLTHSYYSDIISINTVTISRDGIYLVEIETRDGDCERVPLCDASEMEAYMKKATTVADKHPYSIIRDPKKKCWRTTYIEDGKRKYLACKTKKGLLDKLYDIYLEQENALKVSDVYEAWLNNKRGTISDSTLDRYIYDWRRFFVNTGMCDRAISRVTEADLEDFIIDTLKNDPLSTKGYSHFKALILEIWRRAHKSGLSDIVISEFFDEFNVPKKLVVKKKRKDYEEVYPDDERNIVMNHLREHPDTLNLALLLLFLTGMRLGELVSLKKSDFIDDRYLHIQRTETKAMGKGEDMGNKTGITYVADQPKTEAGNRQVYLCEEAVEVVKRLIADPIAAGQEWLLVGKHHKKRVVRATVSERLERVCRDCGVPYRSPHKIRKTYASNLMDAGVPDNVIIAQMGHRDIQTTRQFYNFIHQTNDMRAAWLEKAAKAM